MIKLTKAEEQVMHALWKLERGYLKDILEILTEPKPHSNTVATIIKILVDKNFIGNEVHGRNNCYFPLVSKNDYSNNSITNIVENYFEGSFTSAVSFLIDSKKISISDMELLLKQLKDN